MWPCSNAKSTRDNASFDDSLIPSRPKHHSCRRHWVASDSRLALHDPTIVGVLRPKPGA
jgi:hypothetical protein